jgi:phosphatidylglycerophosphatase A
LQNRCGLGLNRNLPFLDGHYLELDKAAADEYKRRMNFRDRAALFLATGFSVGNIPFAPGTLGSLLGIPVCLGLAGLGLGGSIAGMAAFVFVAVWIAGRAEQVIGKRDAPAIVIDEVAGMVVTLAGLPLTPLNLGLGFVAFRALDIIKPFPARTIDSKMTGGWGVVLDDVVAGLYSNIFLRLISVFFFQDAAA